MLDVSQVFPRTALPQEVMRAALDALDRGSRVVVATVVARHGSAPCTPGQKLALFPDGAALGTVGGGAVERVVLRSMAEALAASSPSPRIDTFRLGASLGMCCGGSADILLEPLAPAHHVLIVGAGHVGIFLAPLLASLGFRVTLCDGREPAANPARLPAVPAPEGDPGPGAVRLLHAEHDDPEVRAGLPEDLGSSAALVMTHDHQLDQAAIEWALRAGFGLVGGVGSRAKAARTRARLASKGFAADEAARVRMPLGVDVGARSPGEIGVAIAAELVAFRAAQTGVVRGARGADRSGEAASAEVVEANANAEGSA
ncbi:XdhC family protein [Polyangium aurulentum]|uniref:XdhC family protein n=1 Tax=Polyangium aurulentum TaxID=2567896 RepID=UPI0010AEB250|nr:XdhC/CoxI family protein [Polyangium aurulentum]UQA54698.1 XdhC/CoxI family protein [Polyangium aurulentum]